MAKLVLLLVFVCFQFSRSEELSAIEQVKLDTDEIPFNDQTAPDLEQVNRDDEIPFNDQTAPNFEQIKLDIDDEIPFNDQTAPDTEQVKLDVDDEIPFNNQTAPDTEVLDGADEDQWYPGPKFNYDWLNEKLPQGDKADKAMSVLEELVALAEKISESSEEDSSYEWDFSDEYDDEYDDDDYEDDDYSFWDIIDWIYNAQNKESAKNGNGKEYAYNAILSLLRPKNPKDDKIGNDLSNEKIHPVKRFTSV